MSLEGSSTIWTLRVARISFMSRLVPRQNVIRAENGAIRLVPRIEKRA
jgi:hypothetical protein